MTAKLGEDYTVSVYRSSEKVDNSDDNAFLLEQMEGAEYTQRQKMTRDELVETLENDPEGFEGLTRTYDSAVSYVINASGLSENAFDEDGASLTGEPADADAVTEEPTDADADDEETVTDAGADANADTDVESNVMTNAVVGASVRLTFAPGEKEKFLVITAKDNRKGDGDRYAYLILSETSGNTVNSALSSCALTITDDEGQDPSEVFFSAASYEPNGDKVTAEMRREGAVNSIAAVKLTSEDGIAKGGRDYSEVSRQLVFPFGVDAQTVEIPVRTSYFTGNADFRVLEDSDGSLSIRLAIWKAIRRRTGSIWPTA